VIAEDVIAAVDAAVAALDATDGLPPGSTRSFAVILDEFDRFSRLVDAIGLAMADPLDEAAAEVLAAGDALIDRAAFALAFAIGHVGQALRRRRRAD
jgi:hypothetical protein